MKVWVRATSSVTIEPNWVISDGSTIADGASSYNGKAIPDMRGSYPKGHPTLSNANFGADTTYFAGGSGIVTGGSSSVNLNHSHGVGNDGSHSHSGSVNSHNHGINNDGTHQHTSDGPAVGNTAVYNNSSGGAFGNINAAGAHAHGSNTQFTAPSLSTSSSSTHNHGGNTNGSLGSTTIDPPNKTLIWIFKIK